MCIKTKHCLCVFVSLIALHAFSQVHEIRSNFDDYFQGDDRKNLTMLKNYLDDKDAARQHCLNEIDEYENKIKALDLDTGELDRVSNMIQSKLKSRPAGDTTTIFSANDLRWPIRSLAGGFGRGTYSNNPKDTSLHYNLALLLDDIADKKHAFKDYLNQIQLSGANLRAINSDRQKAINLIQSIYTVEKGNQDFKTRVSLYFSGIIVVLLVVFFLFIYFKSEHGVANEFLSGNGIQFVALFSLIIAIVLFGILGVLEGRELAAILSGISGFILGKGITKADAKKPQPRGFIPATVTGASPAKPEGLPDNGND